MAINISNNLKFDKWSEIDDFIINVCSSIDKIKKYINSSNITKWDILVAYQHFTNHRTSKLLPFEEFVNSDMFTAQEFYEKFIIEEAIQPSNFSFARAKTILEKINEYKHWKNITNYDELMKYINKFFSQETGFLEGLEYFETHNADIYAKLIQEKPARFYFKKYSEEELFQKPAILLDYINSNLDEDLQNMPSAIPDSSVYEELIGSRRHTILKLCMRNPEKAMTTLKKLVASKYATLKDFKSVATIEEINALPREIKLVLKHPELRWTIHTSAKHICYSMPTGQEWNVIEYFAKKDPEMARSVINYFINSSLVKMSRKIIVEHYKDVDPEKIPPFIQEYISESIRLQESQSENAKQTIESQKRASELRHSQWHNTQDNLIQYFKFEEYPSFFSKEQYFQIAYHFKESGLSATAYCHKYKIDNVEGFRKMLNRVAEEDNVFAKFYEEFSTQKQKDHIASCKNNIISIIEEPTSIPEIIAENTSSRNLPSLVKISEYLFGDPQIINTLIENIILYYHERLNSYDMASLSLEDINKMLTFKEILFMFEPEVIERIKNGSNVDMIREFTKSFGTYKDKLSPELRKLLNASNNSIRERLKPYSFMFNRQSYIMSSTQVPDANGELVMVTDDMIDMAMCYANEHNLFRTSVVMNKIIRAIADGRIQNQEATEDYKNKLKESILERKERVAEIISVLSHKQQQAQPLDE